LVTATNGRIIKIRAVPVGWVQIGHRPAAGSNKPEFDDALAALHGQRSRRDCERSTGTRGYCIRWAWARPSPRRIVNPLIMAAGGGTSAGVGERISQQAAMVPQFACAAPEWHYRTLVLYAVA
jgi:hypothetical protein